MKPFYGVREQHWESSHLIMLLELQVLIIIHQNIALANKKAEELEDEIKDAKQSKTIISKIKMLIYNQLQKHAFVTVLLCASIPNPLFDLAGITCGHFLIPFATFFSATLIGKAIIKTHIQVHHAFIFI